MARRKLIRRALGVVVFLGAAVAAAVAGWGADLMAWVTAVGYFLVAMTFARSLRRGREPLITSFCRLRFGSVPDEAVIYTRRLTQIWAILMSSLVLETVAIELSGHARAWLGPAGVINFCLLVVVFAGEHWLRRILHPHLPKASLLRTGQVMLRWFLLHG